MQPIVYALIIAAVGATTFIAWRQPAAYRRWLHLPLVALVTAAIAGIGLWNLALDNALIDVFKFADDSSQLKLRPAIAGQEFNFRMALVGSLVAYLYLLLLFYLGTILGKMRPGG